jgi:hypothetical protein
MKNKLLACFLIAISFVLIPWCYAELFPFLSQSDPKAMEVFAKKIRAIKINIDTGDDVMQKLGSPQGGSEKLGGRTTWTYNPGGEVFAYIQFDENQKVSAVRVARGFGVINPSAEELYISGDFKTLTSSKNERLLHKIATYESAPLYGEEGQIYFNTSDKHIYFFNGNQWLQLDNPKINP